MKNTIIITILSTVACALYTFMMGSQYNNYWQTSIVKLILFLLIPILFFKISKQFKFNDLLTTKGNKKYLKISALFGVFTFAVIICAYIFLNSFFDKQMIIDGLKNEGITKTSYPFVFAHIVFVNAFLEELFFRGFIFLTLYKLGYKIYAYIFSSVLFALYHISMMGSWFSPSIFALCLVGLIIAGLIFDKLDIHCENIYGGFFVHLSANLAINLIGAYLFYF